MRRIWLVLAVVLWGALAIPGHAEPIPVGGRIVDAAGRPVRGAAVELAPLADRFTGSELRLQGKLFPDPVAKTASRDDGRFEVAAPGPGMWRVSVRAEGFVPRVYELIPALEAVELPLFQMVPATLLPIRVLDPRGQPVTGACVAARDERSAAGPSWSTPAQLVITGADGTARVQGAEGDRLVIEALAAGHPVAQGTSDPAKPVTELRLATGCARTVLVTEPPGRPVEGAVVTAGSWTLGITDAAGRLAVPSPCDRDLRIEAATRDGRRAVATLRRGPVEAPPAALELPARPVRMSGKVVDAGTRKPVAGALVWPGEDPAVFVRTDAQGAYTIPAPAGDDPRVAGAAVGYLPAIETARAAAGPTLMLPPVATVRGFGKVVDTRGRPVAGAAVLLLPGDEGSPFAGSGEPAPAFTDAQGGFVVEGLEPGRHLLQVSARGYAPVSVPGLQIAAGRPRVDLGTVTLAPGAVLAGVVVDPEDRPIAGARVVVHSRMPVLAPPAADGGGEILTAADGSFSAADLQPGEKVMLFVSKKGYANATFHEVLVPTATPLRVVLKPGMRVAGRVVDESGDPVPGAQVDLARAETTTLVAGRGELLDRTGGSGETDRQGRFAIEGVEAGKVRLIAEARGFLAAELPGFEVAAGKDVEGLEVVLRRGSVVTGRVSGPDGAPVDGAHVRIVDEPERGLFSRDTAGTFSDVDGAYRLEGVPEGSRSLAAQGRGFQRAVRDLEVRPGENRLDFRLEASHEVSGRVIDAAGRAVAGATVRLSLTNAQASVAFSGPGMKEVRSGADGTFRFDDVANGVYGMQADKQGYAPAQVEPVDVAASVRGLELRLEAGGAVRGRLVGLELAELAGAMVGAIPGSVPADSREAIRRYRLGQVDFQGEYRIEGLAAGEWRVGARTEAGRQVTGRVIVPAGGEATLDLEFGHDLTLTGRVLREGRPVPNVEVTVLSGGDIPAFGRANTDPQGSFRIAGLEPGTYQLRAMAFGSGIDHRETLEITGDREILIQIATRRVSGRVTDATDQSPLAGAIVSLRPEDERDPDSAFQRGTRSDGDGAFALTDVSPGAYRVTAQLKGYASAEVPVQVTDAADVDGVRLALQPTQGLTLQVRSSLGPPPAEVSAALVGPSGRAVVSGLYPTGENGRVHLPSAPPGRWRLLVQAAGSATVDQEVQVPGPAVQVPLVPGATLIATAAGLPTGARVTVAGPGGQPFYALAGGRVVTEWTVREGTAVIEGLPPGSWRIRAVAADGQTREATATVSPGSTSRIVVP